MPTKRQTKRSTVAQVTAFAAKHTTELNGMQRDAAHRFVTRNFPDEYVSEATVDDALKALGIQVTGKPPRKTGTDRVRKLARLVRDLIEDVKEDGLTVRDTTVDGVEELANGR